MTNRSTPRILIVDDDSGISNTLSAILQSNGYHTTIVGTANEAIEKTKAQFFNLALLDIKLPDMEGTELLSQLQEIAPETVKIIVTGYPSLGSAVDALNFGADSYIMKPLEPSELLRTIKTKLDKQERAERVTKERLVVWANQQAHRIESPDFQEFLANTATRFTDFGLTKTQARVYISLVALGVATVSELAAVSKIRREEIYRMMPGLERRGIIIKKLGVPRRFSALQPETAMNILAKLKLNAIKEEIEALGQKQTELAVRLKNIEVPLGDLDSSTEAISYEDNASARLTAMAQNATREIDAMVSLEILRNAYFSRPKKFEKEIPEEITVRLITENRERDALARVIMKYSEADNARIEVRELDKLPLDILIIDQNEAMWGEFRSRSKKAQSFWTNNPIQILILKTCFESFWQKQPAMKSTSAIDIPES